MNTLTRPDSFRFRLLALALAAFYCSQSSSAADKAPDPWLEEQLANPGAARAEEEDKDYGQGAARLRKKSPQALHAALMADYKKLPETAISRRIDILQEAVAVSPGDSATASATLAGLRDLKRAATEATQAAGSASTVEDGFAIIEPYVPYYAGDIDLRAALTQSKYARDVVASIRELGEAGDYERLASLQARLAQTGLDRLIGDSAQRAFQDSLASSIEQKWLAALGGSAPLPGERFLIERMLKQSDAKLVLQLDVSENASAPAARQLEESIRRQWGRDFQIVSGSATAAADLLLQVELGDANVSRSESSSVVKSAVPGKIAEEPNPEFMDAVEKYKKAAKSYESALKAYETQYKNFIDNMNGGTMGSVAQSNLRGAQASFNNAAASADFSSAEGRATVAMAADSLKVAESVAASYQGSSPPEPVKPYPHHLRHLDTIYSIPSTIIIAEDSTPYEYTATTLDFTIASSASLALKTPNERAPAASASLALDRKRSWTQNIGIDKRDPTAGPGTFSEDELQSAKDLFNLEFGAACAKKLDELFRSAAQRASGDAEKLLLGLSLKLRESPTALSDAELRALAAAARSADVSPQSFRRDVLHAMAKKIAGNSAPSPEQIERIL